MAGPLHKHFFAGSLIRTGIMCDLVYFLSMHITLFPGARAHGQVNRGRNIRQKNKSISFENILQCVLETEKEGLGHAGQFFYLQELASWLEAKTVVSTVHSA